MTRRTLVYFIIFLFQSIFSLKSYASGSDSTNYCQLIFEEYQNAFLNNKDLYFNECENCCLLLNQDSLLLELYSSHNALQYLDSAIYFSIESTRNCKGCSPTQMLGDAFKNAAFLSLSSSADKSIYYTIVKC